MSTSIVYPDADPEIARLLTGNFRKRLDNLGIFDLYMGRPQTREEYLARIEGAEALLLGWDLSIDVMREANNLRMISFTGTGADNMIDLTEASRLGIKVTNTPGYANDSVAEHALTLLLAAAHRVVESDMHLRQGRWGKHDQPVEMRGKTLGLIGFGGIGARMAELASCLGMNVIAWTRHPERHRETGADVNFMSFADVLAESDAVSLHLSLNVETWGIIGEHELGLMKTGALFVNTARGELVDEEALGRRLALGELSAAGLDVFANEPLSSEHPLCDLENVVLTPHSAFQTPEATTRL